VVLSDATRQYAGPPTTDGVAPDNAVRVSRRVKRRVLLRCNVDRHHQFVSCLLGGQTRRELFSPRDALAGLAADWALAQRLAATDMLGTSHG